MSTIGTSELISSEL